MVEFLTFLSNKLSGTALYIVVAVVGCVLMAPQVVKVWDSWKDFRSGKAELTTNKMQLEVLKLRYEVEILKEKLTRSLDADSKPLATPSATASNPVAQSGPAPVTVRTKKWAWLRKLASHNRSQAIVVLNLLRLIAWIALLSFGGLLAFSLCFIVAPPTGMTSSEASSTLVLFLPATLAFYLAVHRLKVQKRALSGAA